jgi:broad-specificity NMP kinase
MGKSILITGVSGSGKSAVCEELKKLGHNAYDIGYLRDLCRVVDKKTGEISKDYDPRSLESVKKHKFIRDKNLLQEFISKNSEGTVFYCGSASNIDDLLPLFDKIFMLEVSDNVLCERLASRTSNNFGRTPEIQAWILSWKKGWEDHMREKGAIVMDGNRSLREMADSITKMCE